MNGLRVLLLDSDTAGAAAIRRRIEDTGSTVRISQLLEPSALGDLSAVDVIVVAEAGGLGELSEAAPSNVRFVLVGDGRNAGAELGERLGGCLPSPVPSGLLEATLSGIAEQVRLRTDNAQLDREVERWRREWQATVDAIQDPIAVAAADGRLLRVNCAFELRFGGGHRALIGGFDADVLFADRFAPSAGARVIFATYETTRLRAPGNFLVNHYPMALADGPGVLYHITDVTARTSVEAALRDSEEQLQQAQKMEAVGRLASGVAHDFNNLLTTIVSGAELITDDLPRSATTAHEVLDQVRDAAHRGAALTRQLLSFSKPHAQRPRILDPHATLLELGRMMRRLLGEDIDLEIVAEPGLRSIRIDRTQLEQIALNLAVNARDAMVRGGTLTFRTMNTERKTDDGEVPCVALIVTDTGCGMDEGTLARAFEPFFTTKSDGRGTGLGLAVVRSIVDHYDGEIELRSTPGAGTVARITLPATEAPLDATDTPPMATRSLRGQERVLVVEDEDGIRRIVTSVLRKYGYKVLGASSGQQAIELVARHAGKIDILLTDLVMPAMSGGELAELLLSSNGAMKVLTMSAYESSSERLLSSLGAEYPFLAKPFRPAELAAKLREVLDAETGPA